MTNLGTPSYIVEFDSPQALDPAMVGGKAASVADLVGKGATVPTGFAINASAFADFIESVKDDISDILKIVDVENAASSFEAANAIAELLAAQPTPPSLESAITIKLTSHASTTLAVRSSSTAEDLQSSSFAGMYDTFLDAEDAESVIKRIRDVWTSYFTGRAISYRQRQGVPHESGSMAILVMELVNAQAGGVVFTRDPRDGTDQIRINATFGLGVGVVSGEAESDSFTLDSESLAIVGRNVIDKEWMFISDSSGYTERVPVPTEMRSAPTLSDSQLFAIAKAATTIKKSAGDDRDIEFAVVGEKVHILQSRPITTGSKKESEFPVEWDSPEQEKLHWQTGGKNAAFPLVIDQVFMQGEAEKRSVDFTGQIMGRMNLKKLVNGWLYSAESPRDPEVTKNTQLKFHLKGRRLLNKGTSYFSETIEPHLRSNLARLERARPVDSAPIPEHISYLRNAMELITDHMNDLHWRGASGFNPKDRNELGDLFAEITGRPAIEASNLLLATEHMTARLTRRLFGLAALVKSDSWLTEAFEQRDYQVIFARGAGKRSVVLRFRARFNSMMKTWGCRNGIGYGSAWKATDPSWNMKPEIPLDLIGSYLRQDLPDGRRLHAGLIRKRNAAIAAVQKKIGRNPKLRKSFDFQLFRETTRVQFMENHNYLVEQRSNGEYRESINRVGMALVRENWVDTPDDIFFLRLGQLDDAVDSDDYSRLRSLIIQAKADHAENSKLDRPDFLGTKPPEDKKDEDEPLRGLSEDGLILHGEPSSSGASTGTARVVLTRTSSPPDVKKGDILVTDNTGPDWVPIFPLLGGLVLDSGDNFQHASIISREYGIPCVIQTKEATKLITNGQLITVDGSAGTVTLNPMV